jgi:hypothetical protein
MPCPLSHSSRSPNGEVVRGGEANVLQPEKKISRMGEKSREVQPLPQPPRPIRPALHRSREEEYKAYGRTFVGSGQQDDYDTMTKLGEGTFGYVFLLAVPA